MPKVTRRVDTDAILERMRIGLKYETAAELASFFGLSPQAIGNSRTRGSISLTLIMEYVDKTGIPVDYILYGTEHKHVAPLNADAAGNNDSHLAVSTDWVKSNFSINMDSVRYYIDKDGSYLLIDISENAQKISDGKYLLETGMSMSVRECKMKIGGKLAVEGEEALLSPEEASQLKVVGRVIYRCTRV